MKHKIYLIAAIDNKGGIGKKNQLPWHLPEDLAFFQRITTKTERITRENMVIMGRKTWESIPEKHRPLSGRRNVVLTRNKDFKVDGVYTCHSFKEALELADEDTVERIFVIGGGKVFAEAMKHSRVSGLYITKIHKVFDCDTTFPKIPKRFKAKKLGSGEQDGVKYDFLLLKK